MLKTSILSTDKKQPNQKMQLNTKILDQPAFLLTNSSDTIPLSENIFNTLSPELSILNNNCLP